MSDGEVEDGWSGCGRDRVAFVSHEDFTLVPQSLVGSWFHRLENDEIVWQGVVVAEPQSGVYLCSVDRLALGVKFVQRLVTLEKMSDDDDGQGWRFYDNEEACRVAYAAWVVAAEKLTNTKEN